jgi:HK97 family phage major capsid protein
VRAPSSGRSSPRRPQKGLKALLEENEQDTSRESVRRLNAQLSPQDRGAGMLTKHRQATAHNPHAIGAKLDGMFTDSVDFIHTAWHLNNSPEANAKRAQITNAFGSVAPSDGGFLVPETLRSQLLEVALETAVVRPRATVVPMESARVPFPMIDSTSNASSVFGGMVAYWGEEGATLTDSSAKFGRIVLDAKKLTGLSAVPNELLSDSLISFSALIERLWPEAVSFYEDVAFLGGSGTGEPLGLIGASNPASVAVTAETGQATGTVLYENIVKQYSRMLPSSLSRAVWIVSPDTIPELFTMALSVGTGGNAIFVANAQGPAPLTIFGRPVIVSEKASAVGTRGDVVFVDLSYYLVGDRQQMSVSSSTDYNFGSDKTTFRIIQRVDGRPWLQSAITPRNGSTNTLSSFRRDRDAVGRRCNQAPPGIHTPGGAHHPDRHSHPGPAPTSHTKGTQSCRTGKPSGAPSTSSRSPPAAASRCRGRAASRSSAPATTRSPSRWRRRSRAATRPRAASSRRSTRTPPRTVPRRGWRPPSRVERGDHLLGDGRVLRRRGPAPRRQDVREGHAEQRRARHRGLQRPRRAADPGEPRHPVRLTISMLPTGHDLACCPQCGSRACMTQAPGPHCRHTRRPRQDKPSPTPTPPAQRKSR